MKISNEISREQANAIAKEYIKSREQETKVIETINKAIMEKANQGEFCTDCHILIVDCDFYALNYVKEYFKNRDFIIIHEKLTDYHYFHIKW